MIYAKSLLTLAVGLPFLESTLATPISTLQARSNVNDFCYDSFAGTKQLWTDNDVGVWFQIIANEYGVDTGIEGAKPWDRNIQSTLKIYAPNVNSFQCLLMGDTCNFSYDEEHCKSAGAMGYFVLWAVQHYNAYLGRVTDAVTQASTVLNSWLPNMPLEFTNDKNPPSDNTSPFLGIIQAFFIAASWAYPPAAAPIAGIGLANGILGLNKPPNLAAFTDYALASEATGNITLTIYDQISELANKTLLEIPSNTPGYKYSEDPAGLVQSLMNGEFAEDVASKVPNAPDGMLAVLSSVPINWLWNKMKLIITKVNSDNYGSDVCANGGLFPGFTYCDPNGNAYIIHTFELTPKGDGETLQDIGYNVYGVDKLPQYKLDLGKVAVGSEWTQQQTKAWQSNVDPETIRQAVQQDPGSQGPELQTVFNLPVCDLTKLVPLNPDFMKGIFRHGGQIDGIDNFKQTVICLCGTMDDFPYQEGSFRKDCDNDVDSKLSDIY